MRKSFALFNVFASACLAWLPSSVLAADRIFTLSNDPANNAVVSFLYSNGNLIPAGSFSTGGQGTGASLGNQGALAMTEDRRFLVVSNAGSDQISVFRIVGGGLILVDKVSSGGTRPLSVTTYRSLVYVLNGGGVNNITGFRLTRNGQLRPLQGSTETLSAPSTGPAQIGFSPDGKTLVVTEKATNMITTFGINQDTGLPETKHSARAPGDTPFGFDFQRDGPLFISEAFGGAASALSSFSLFENGELGVISPSVKAGDERAACWVEVEPTGKFAFVTNTASNSLSTYSLEEGRVTLVDAIGGTTGAAPTDVDSNKFGSRIFVLNRDSGNMSIFRFQRQTAKLTPELESGVVLTPGAATGLVIR